MKTIFFVSNVSLKNPNRGTPLRIVNILYQLEKYYHLIVCTQDVPDGAGWHHISYPDTKKGWQRIQYLAEMIKQNKADLILGATESNIKILVFLKYITGLPIALDVHGLAAKEAALDGQKSSLQTWFKELVTKIFLTKFGLIFVVSNKLGAYFCKYNSNIVTIYGGINESEFSTQIDSKDSEKIFSIGYMGNTRVYQGVDELLGAATLLKKQQKKFRLHLVMSGSSDIAERLKKIGLDEITDMIQDVSHDEAVSFIRRSSVLAIPRPKMDVTEYAFPSKLPECLAIGVPVITTDVGPVSEFDGSTRFMRVIPAEKIAENLAAAVSQLMDTSLEDRLAMGQRARNYVKRYLTWNVLGLEMKTAIDKLLNV